jgi:hypothetical protein
MQTKLYSLYSRIQMEPIFEKYWKFVLNFLFWTYFLNNYSFQNTLGMVR